MFYFSKFPKISYKINGGTRTVLAIDITKRIKVIESLLKNKYVFYMYSVKEGERADIIAAKYYKDSTLDWLIWMVNLIYDPFFQWPLNTSELGEYIERKYGSLEDAKQTVYEYYWVIQEKQINYDGSVTPEQKLVIDHATYLTLDDPSRSSITQYDWEVQQNENRRIIKILDKSYVPLIITEFNSIFD